MFYSHLRGLCSNCGWSNLVLKYKKGTSFTKPCLMIDEHLSQYFMMCSFRQFVVICCKRISNDERTNNSVSSLTFLRQKRPLRTHPVLLKNIKAEEVMSTILKDINFEEIKEQVQKERKLSEDGKIHMATKIKEAVSRKCDDILANLSPEDEKKLKVIKLEHSFFFSEGYKIPDSEEMLNENWLQALLLPSKKQRLKYYTSLTRQNITKETIKMKQVAKDDPLQEKEKVELYEHGRLFMRIYETTMRRWLNYRLAASMQFGIPLVIDMDYVSHMHAQEMKNTANQLHSLYTYNRADEKLPFHLHFTSCQPNNPVYRLFQVLFDEDQEFFVTVSEKSYLDLFDKESLVYLSPHGRQVMKELDPNVVYIIGAVNDKATQQPLSYARAKEQQIKCQRLPLDLFLKWNQGSKSLSLDQMIKIMVSLKNKKSWQEAFQAVPGSKIHSEESDR